MQRQLKERGITMLSEADESSTGPASFMIAEPDGNTILIDQQCLGSIVVGVLTTSRKNSPGG